MISFIQISEDILPATIFLPFFLFYILKYGSFILSISLVSCRLPILLTSYRLSNFSAASFSVIIKIALTNVSQNGYQVLSSQLGCSRR